MQQLNKMYPYEHFYIAVDFDDTCVFSGIKGLEYPKFDGDIPGAVDALRELSEYARIILLTSREGEALDTAVRWFDERDIPLFSVNENIDPYWLENKTRKVYADLIIDDKCVNIPVASNGLYCYPDWGVITVLARKRIRQFNCYQEYFNQGKRQ